MNIKEVIEKKGKAIVLLKEAINAKDFDQLKVDTISDEITALDNQKKSLEKANELIAQKADETDEQVEKKAVEKKKAVSELDAFIRTGENGRIDKSIDKRAYVYNLTDATGGYFVPDEIGSHIQTAEAWVGGMVTPGLCTHLKVANGRKIEVPCVDDTAINAAVVAEATALTSGSVPTYTTSDLDFYKITSHIVQISRELLQDSAFDVVAHATEILMKRMQRGINYYFTLGTSGSHPVGIQTLSTKGVDAAKRGLTPANLTDLIYSVNRAYRKGAAWQMNDSTIGYIRKLAQSSGSTGQDQLPAWQESLRAGEPNLLHGYPVIANNEMDEIASYNQSVFFGDWKRYYIAEALPMTMIRMDELYAASDQIGLVVLGRWAGNLIADTGDAPIKHIRHANT